MNRSSAKSEIFGEVEIFRKIYDRYFSENIYGSDSKMTIQIAKKNKKKIFKKFFEKFFFSFGYPFSNGCHFSPSTALNGS